LGCSESNLKKLVLNAELLFEKLKPIHQLGANWKDYFLIATIFRDTGWTVSPVEHEKHTYYILKNAELPLSQEDFIETPKEDKYFEKVHNFVLVSNKIAVEAMQKTAEELGYVKIDLLNVHVYNQITSTDHLDRLATTEPVWDLLRDRDFVSGLIHVNAHYDLLQQHFPDTMDKLAMVLALIRPSKRYLIGRTWRQINEEIWQKPTEGYYFKRSHATSYALLVMVHMNLLSEFAD
jgi:hypothetical protein